MNAGLASATARTKATRTGGFAASKCLGSWNRASPYATNRKGVFSSSFNSPGATCTVCFLVQQVRASSNAAPIHRARVCVNVLRVKIIVSHLDSESIVPCAASSSRKVHSGQRMSLSRSLAEKTTKQNLNRVMDGTLEFFQVDGNLKG